MTYAFFATLCALLAIAAAVDLRTHRLPDALNAAIAVLGCAFVAVTHAPVLDALIGAAFGYGLIWGVNALYRARRGRDGVGMGDAKLLAAGGLWVGWFGVPFVVLIAASLALATLAVSALRGKALAPTDRIAFGPFLAVALAVVVALQTWVV
jgi:leader peptidase (prepilin peptidase)/N-methyltransferase